MSLLKLNHTLFIFLFLFFIWCLFRLPLRSYKSVRVVNGFAGGTGAYGKLDFGTFGACIVATFLGFPMIYTRDDEIADGGRESSSFITCLLFLFIFLRIALVLLLCRFVDFFGWLWQYRLLTCLYTFFIFVVDMIGKVDKIFGCWCWVLVVSFHFFGIWPFDLEMFVFSLSVQLDRDAPMAVLIPNLTRANLYDTRLSA